jgi:hypothetical protein
MISMLVHCLQIAALVKKSDLPIDFFTVFFLLVYRTLQLGRRLNSQLDGAWSLVVRLSGVRSNSSSYDGVMTVAAP